MSGREAVLLGEMPSLSKLYLNAAAVAARSRVLGSGSVKTLPEAVHEVRGVRADAEKLTAFQHLLGLPARDWMPAGFVHVLGFPLAVSVMSREDFPLPLLGMIHLRNRVEQFRPVHYTRDLTLRSWADNVQGHRVGTQADLVVEVRDGTGGELLWRGVSTYLARGVFLPGVDKPAPRREPDDFSPPDPTALWRLGPGTGRDYAAVSGDFNPIHLSTLTARALGMRGMLAHGMYLASRALGEALPNDERSFTWDVDFGAPVFLPSTVALHFADAEDASGSWVRSDYAAWNARTGRKHFSGSVLPLGPGSGSTE
ncbi:hypothetical protein KIH31_04285 [Paenarthrobacter sp. DKR-5]|uniref:MaoC family dehydratase n=1 Tax=Paenarthrobacter sp. DKR-5 TaxID=2835535 RepID=UPI001BDC7690|nr:MaoC/PaaZ C-terminal domain-containing protein [Paenarthrobacter sp. DKR-5]MBT1001813.1 hypothetical protein [Paenarthrobacter sp. DKR-5]